MFQDDFLGVAGSFRVEGNIAGLGREGSGIVSLSLKSSKSKLRADCSTLFSDGFSLPETAIGFAA